MLLPGHEGKLRGLQWVDGAQGCDFVVVSDLTLELYKLYPGLRPVLVRKIAFEFGHYWFEGQSGFLLGAAAPPHLGLIQVFLPRKPIKQVQGPKFAVSIDPSVTNQWTESPFNSSRLPCEKDPRSQVTGLFRLYDMVCFLHLHCKTGVGRLYRVEEETVQALEVDIKVPPRERYEVVVCDNLLLVSSPMLQESFVFDVKGKKGAFCLIHHGLPQNPPIISLKIDIDRDQKQYFPLLTVLYDKRNLSQALPPSSSPFAHHFLESEAKLDPSLLTAAADILVDMHYGRCYKVMVDPTALAEEFPDLLQAVLFLLRRIGCKQAAYACLKEAIIRKVDFSALSRLFYTVNDIYKQAARDRRYSESKKPSFRKAQSPSSPRKLSLYPSDSELKLTSGETVMLQADVLSLLFAPLASDFETDLDYLLQVMLEYQRSLIDYDIQVHSSLQLLIAKVAIKAEAFPLLEGLVQGQVVSDSRELASMLLAVSSPNTGARWPAFFPLALDMMKRLQLFEDLMDVFLSHKMIYEALATLAPRDAGDWKRIADAAEELGDEALKSSVIRRMQD